MKLSTILHSALVLAATSMALAPPLTHPKLASSSAQVDKKLSKKERAATARDEHFSKLGKKSYSRESRDDVEPNTIVTSPNWSGATITPPSGQTFKSVTSTMTLPKLTEPNQAVGPGGEYFLYVWVGIDGDGDCGSDGLWQTGFAGQIDDGVTSWWGWVCFITNSGTVLNTMILNATTGDSVNMTVEALSDSEGIFWLENLSTGKTESYDVAGGNLCLESAEWIVEDPFVSGSDGGYFLVWPDFGTMTFDNAVAYTNNGTAVGPQNAEFLVIDNIYNGVTQNSVSVTDNTVSVTWLASGPGT